MLSNLFNPDRKHNVKRKVEVFTLHINIMTGGPERRSCRIVTEANLHALQGGCVRTSLRLIGSVYTLYVVLQYRQPCSEGCVSGTYARRLCGLRPVPLYFISGSVLTWAAQYF